MEILCPQFLPILKAIENLATYLFQYEEYGEDFVDMLDGMFSFVLLDTRDKSFIAARDAIGITPLYVGWGLDGTQFHPCIKNALFS
jgi:asparagine synthetase B (glutamine-hydrolysing)